jgi:hypothetical protein
MRIMRIMRIAIIDVNKNIILLFIYKNGKNSKK